MSEQRDDVPDGCLALAKQIVHAYTRDDRREPNSRDIEIARMIWTEITAREAASAEAMRKKISATLRQRSRESALGANMNDWRAALRTWANLAESVPIPHASVLARALAAAEKRGMERAAEIARRVEIPGDCSAAEAHGRMTAALAAAEAIRNAAAQEIGEC